MGVKGQEEVPANVDGVESNHEIDDMLSDSPLEEEAEETPVVEEEEPEVEEQEEQEEEAETLEEEEVEVDPTPVQEPVEKSEAELLREQLSSLSSVLIQHGINPADIGQVATQQQEGQAETPTPQAKPPVDNTEIELGPLEISKEEFDGIFEDPANFVKVLNRVRESAVEQVLRSIPTVTAKIVNQQTVLNRMVQDFYTANNDLAGMKPFVAVVANEIAARNPGWNVEQVFAEAAVESRKRLNLRKDVGKPAVGDVQKPGLPKTGAARRTPAKPKLSAFEQELNDLM